MKTCKSVIAKKKLKIKLIKGILMHNINLNYNMLTIDIKTLLKDILLEEISNIKCENVRSPQDVESKIQNF